MANLLGCYWSVMHRLPRHYEYMKGLQPTVVKIMDGGQPDYQWVYQNVPGALVLARDWALSEQHDDMTGDPIGTGERHAQEWNQHANRLGLDRSRTLVLGINEPRVWEHSVPECLRLYTIAFLDECHRLGLRAGAMQFSVGWPANQGGDTPPDWTPFWGVEDAIKRGNHVLVLHEYWADMGPGEMWGWWGGRALKCPWQVPIVIGECGVDMYVKDASVEQAKRGWQGRMSPERYAAELREYTWRMAADSRFAGDCVFALDFANGEWASFDVTPAIGAILAQPPVVAQSAPVTVHLPIVGNGGQPVENSTPVPQGILDPLVLEAILQIESGGRSLGDDKRPIIRFETHIFKQQLGNDALWAQHFRYGSPIWTGQQMLVDGEWKDIHVGSQAREWQAFEKAAALDYEAAAQSISMGAPQIMGFNHASVGYPSATAMLEAFGDESIQTIAFINFILGRQALVSAVRNKDWREIARIYNGASNVDQYAPLLQGAYSKLKERA